MTNPSGVAVEADLDFDPAEDAPVELTLEQQLSKMPLRQLQQEAKRRNLSGAGNTVELIRRITAFEESGGIIPEDADLGLKSGVAPAPADPTVAAPGPGNSHLTGQTPGRPPATTRAAADVVPPSSAAQIPPLPTKTGYQERTNTWRSEFPVGSRRELDDTTHFQFLQDTHTDAANAGMRSKGAPYAGKRIGRSRIEAGGRMIDTVIYEVSVFPPDHVNIDESF